MIILFLLFASFVQCGLPGLSLQSLMVFYPFSSAKGGKFLCAFQSVSVNYLAFLPYTVLKLSTRPCGDSSLDLEVPAVFQFNTPALCEHEKLFWVLDSLASMFCTGQVCCQSPAHAYNQEIYPMTTADHLNTFKRFSLL